MLDRRSLFLESGSASMSLGHREVTNFRGDAVRLACLEECAETDGSPAARDEPRRSFELMATEKLTSFVPWPPGDVHRSDTCVQTEVCEEQCWDKVFVDGRDVVSVSRRTNVSSRTKSWTSRSRRNTSRLGSRTILSHRDVLCKLNCCWSWTNRRSVIDNSCKHSTHILVTCSKFLFAVVCSNFYPTRKSQQQHTHTHTHTVTDDRLLLPPCRKTHNLLQTESAYHGADEFSSSIYKILSFSLVFTIRLGQCLRSCNVSVSVSSRIENVSSWFRLRQNSQCLGLISVSETCVSGLVSFQKVSRTSLSTRPTFTAMIKANGFQHCLIASSMRNMYVPLFCAWTLVQIPLTCPQ